MAKKKGNKNKKKNNSPSLGNSSDISSPSDLDIKENPSSASSDLDSTSANNSNDVPSTNTVLDNDLSQNSSTDKITDDTATTTTASAEAGVTEQLDKENDKVEPVADDPPAMVDDEKVEDNVELVVNDPPETTADDDDDDDDKEEVGGDNDNDNDAPESDVTISLQEGTTNTETPYKPAVWGPPEFTTDNNEVDDNDKLEETDTGGTILQQEEDTDTTKIEEKTSEPVVADDLPVTTDDKPETGDETQQQEETETENPPSEPVVVVDQPNSIDDDGEEYEEDNDASVPVTKSSDSDEKWEKQESEIIAEKEDIDDDNKAKAEQEDRETALKEARRKSEEVSKKLAEIEAKLKADQEANALAEANSRLEETKKIAAAVTTTTTTTTSTNNNKEEEENSTVGDILEESEQHKVIITKEESAANETITQQTNKTDDVVENISSIPDVENNDKPGESEDICAPESSDGKKEEPITSIEPISTQFEQVEDVNGDEKDTIETPQSQGESPNSLSFAQAFSNKKLPPRPSPSPGMLTPTPSLRSAVSVEGVTYISDSQLTPNSAASHSALSAARNKKASGLISKYEDKVSHEPLPGDSVPIRSAKGPAFSPSISPGSQGIIKRKMAATTVELAHLPNLNSVREKFEKSSRKSGGGSFEYEYGESFRQKKRHEQLSERERKEEAKVAMRGFNERELNQGRTATGEIDTSSLPKSFTFEMSSFGSITPIDGVCRVDYKSADFQAMVFVVHRTRGMLLLQGSKASSLNSRNNVPGGAIIEEEFLDAAKQSGSPQVQLQIAARIAAARQLFETTGLDIRQQANRFKPAVLNVNPPMDPVRGFQYLRNENENKLYYFLQVDEDDFSKLKDQQEVALNAKSKKPSVDAGDEPVSLKLSNNYSGFEFVHDPVDATDVLKKDGNDAATALNMIMNAAAMEIKENSLVIDDEKGPDAKATVHFNTSNVPDDERDGSLVDGRVRTVGKQKSKKEKQRQQEKDKNKKKGKKTNDNANGNTFQHDEAKAHLKSPSIDPAEEMVAVGCCCSFW
jgi:hypothetical protein